MIQRTLQLSGCVLVALGVLAVAFGSVWAAPALEPFDGNPVIGPFELLVPFLPIFLIALGAFLLVKSRR